ncbi:DUF1254 domain-containing protein [Cohaesibacter celericrescens]|nr:hypothetical protein [Cohaesibacter celericrescens]
MIRLAFILGAALLMAVIIHIATIFAIPYNSQNDVWHRMLSLGPLHRIHTVSDPKEAIALSQDLDPAFAYGICRVDLTDAPILLKGNLTGDFWSLNYLDRQGRSQFSVTNQISGPVINVVLATRGQQRLLSERPDLIEDTTIIISATENQGLLLLRAFVASERNRSATADAISALSCGPLWRQDTL